VRWRHGEGDYPLLRLGPCLGVRRIDSREVDSTVKAVQARKVRQLYAMLDGTNRRAAAVRR
jgi:hypothetical protein